MLRFYVGVNSPNAKPSPSMYITFVGIHGTEHYALSDANYAHQPSSRGLILQLLQSAGVFSGAAKMGTPLVQRIAGHGPSSL